MNLNPFRRRPSNPARELAAIGIEQRRQKVLAVARQIREEKGLAPDPRLA